MKRLFFFGILIAMFAFVANAQTSRGIVSGTVADPTGAVIPGAEVTLTNTGTTVTRSAVTNGEGFYRFDAVDLGTYTVNITATGFGKLIKTNVTVNANQTSSVDAQLAPGTQAVSVDVIAESGAALQTEAPVRGGNISTRQIVDLPFAGRNPVALALTLPGVSSNRGGFGVGTFSVNGARGRSNNFLIDGTENNDISVAGQGFQITNPDAVQEVSVQTSNYDSEFGRSGGAVINTITKSGTNKFHGTASFLLDSTRDDAITSSLGRDPAILARGRLNSGTENIYAGTFGGPLYLPRFGEGGPSLIDGRERTFFFVAYQEDRQRSTAGRQFTTLTQAGRDTLRSQFAPGVSANVDRLLNATANAVAPALNSNFLALGAAPGSSATSSTTCTAGAPAAGNRPCVEVATFFRNFPSLSMNRQYQIRIDHKLTDNDQLSGRFLSDRTNQPQGGQAGFPGFDVDFASKYYNFLIAETHVFSPTVTNELRLAYNRIDLGFPFSSGNDPNALLPFFTVAGLSIPGIDATFPQGRIANNYQVQDTVTKVFGTHTFRGGVDYLRQISTQAAPFNSRGSVTFTSSTGRTALSNFVDNFGGTGNGAAAIAFGSAVYFPSLHRTAVFAQDRWKATESLTLTYGLRYERFGTAFNTLRTPAFTGLFNVNPTTLDGPFGRPNQVAPDNNNFAPTVGIAYSPSFTDGFLGRLFGEKKSVIRAGYQIGYDSFFNNIASNAATSSPNVVGAQTTSTSSAGPRGIANFSTQFPTTQPALSPFSPQTLIDPNLVNPYYQRYSLGMQRELPYKVILDVSYVGSKGTRLFINEAANPLVRPELRVTPAGYTGTTSGRLDNIQGQRTVRTNGGSSSYNSGQLSVSRRYADNFTVTGAYTYSKLIDNASEVFAAGGASSTSFFAVPAVFGGSRLDRGLSLFDRTHRASFTYVAAVPYFREQHGVIGHILGGFEISGVTTFESGVPFTVFNGNESDGLEGSNRPDFNPNGQRGVRAVPEINTSGTAATNPNFGRLIRYFNPDIPGNPTIDPNTAQFIVNPTFIPGNAFESGVARTGTLGRNTERGPGTNNFNVNILKRTNITETTRLEFRTEFYNIFNHPQFTQGSVSPFTPGGGSINSNAQTAPIGRFLNPDTPGTDGGGRSIRYQVKFIF